MRKSLLVVPARGGSEGISGKNLKIIKGKELVIRSIIHGTELVDSNCLVLSTDSIEIISCVAKFFGYAIPDIALLDENSISKFGKIWLHFRGSELAGSTALICDVMIDIRSNFLSRGVEISNWCLLQPTSPFRNSNELAVFGNLLEGNFDDEFSVVSVARVIDMHPARMYQMGSNAILTSLDLFDDYKANRRQDLPEVYIRDGGFYLMSDHLVSRKLQFTKNPIGIIREGPWTINIDSANDLELARLIPLSDLHEDPNEGVAWST